MSGTIRHQGIVTDIKHGKSFVQVVRQSSCSECNARGFCAASEMKNMIIEVEMNNFKPQNGQTVEIEGSLSMGLKAVLLSFVIPSLLILVILIVVSILSANELLAALSAIAILILYGLVLYLKRERLKQKFTFRIIKIIE